MSQLSDEHSKSERNAALRQEMIENTNRAPMTSEKSEVTQFVEEDFEALVTRRWLIFSTHVN
ncbi:MAG: hypothetical protein ACW97A_11005 [Candidatus Thorarchaeota archaeon]|jgi:hypothetical protein